MSGFVSRRGERCLICERSRGLVWSEIEPGPVCTECVAWAERRGYDIQALAEFKSSGRVSDR